jgi:glutaminyl-peptide cyclotransferase
MRRLLVTTAMFVAVFVAVARPGTRTPTPVDRYRVVHVYPHDPTAFTQGLVFRDGVLYEGTGLNGRSSIRKVKLETGEVLQSRALGAEHFGEGIAVWKSRIVQLTWRSQVGFVYDLATFTPQRSFQYTGEGWGLTHDGSRLIESDGSAVLRFWNPDTFAEERRLTVTDGAPVERLNELEYVRGEIYANVWQTNRLARIDPVTGRVKRWIDLTGLLPAADRHAEVDVLNGIAYDAVRRRLFVTGKLWPKLFEIEIVPK